MARAIRHLGFVLTVLGFIFLAGFVVFASFVARQSDNSAVGSGADGIVVVTGGQHRLVEAARLLAEGRGKRLLISGANRQSSRDDIHRRTGLDAAAFEHVDIGYEALDTIGNADETAEWARRLGFRRLIIVTSAYHMPRTLIELQRAMPEGEFIPYRVVSSKLHPERWWLHFGTARLLLSEYVKVIPSAARLAVSRLSRPKEGEALAEDRAS